MAEFNIRTDSVDVEQIMRQIRARINEKRGVDYTEQQIQDLANVKLERFLDPKGIRSDLVEQFKRTRGTSPEPPNYGFEDTTLYETHRGIVRFIRRLLNPLLKLFINPNPVVHVLHMQGQINNINARQFRVREELDGLYYEVIHNLVLEVTRLGIEAKNMKMRLESLNSRIDFDQRRARALEGVVQYKSGTGPAREPQPQASPQFRPSSGGAGGGAAGRPHQQRQQSQANTAPPREQPPPREPREPREHPQREQPREQAREQPAQIQIAPADPSPQDPRTELVEGDAPATSGELTDAAAGTARRRRRRRRGRRGGRGREAGEQHETLISPTPDEAGTPPHGDPTADAALDAHPDGADSPDDSGPESGGDSESGADEGPDPSEQ